MSDTQDLPTESEQELTVEEFCRRLSVTDRRVELLGAFHFDEKRNGRVKDTETNFRARFDEFANKPVK
jgi:hypothetical protein